MVCVEGELGTLVGVGVCCFGLVAFGGHENDLVSRLQ
jgi:hypothetical protein